MTTPIHLTHETEDGILVVDFDVRFKASREHGPEIHDLELVEVTGVIERIKYRGKVVAESDWDLIDEVRKDMAEACCRALMRRNIDKVLDQLNEPVGA